MAEGSRGEESFSIFLPSCRASPGVVIAADVIELKKRKPDRTSELSDAPGRDAVTIDLTSPLFQLLLKKQRCAGRNLRAVMMISIEESAVGGSKRIELNRLVACSACAGSSDGACCFRCAGKRVASAPLDERVDFLPGVLSGHQIVLDGAGDATEDVLQGCGDLTVDVRVAPHPLFHRVGDDYHMELLLTFAQATLGCTLFIPSVYGQAMLVIPPGTQSHSFLSISNEGFPIPAAKNERGCMVVKVVVHVPGKISVEEAALLRQFDKNMRNRSALEVSRFLT